MNLQAAIDELEKLGAISDEEARRSLDRLDALEKTKMSPHQVADYATVGAVAGPTVRMATDFIKHRKMPKVTGRGMLADAVGGALTAGAIPLARNHLDHRREVGTLGKYVQERSKGT